jgi:alkylated DNA nucleotide flippase Atl1
MGRWGEEDLTQLAELLATDGASSALANADEEWRDVAQRELDQLIATGRDFTADDLTRIVGFPENRNAVGGLIRANRKRLQLVRIATAQRDVSHAHLLRVWRGVA